MPDFLSNIFSDIRCEPDADLDRLALKHAEAGFHKFIDVEILRRLKGLVGHFKRFYLNILTTPV